MSNISIILKNSFHLYAFQASLYLFPLITFPYLFRVLGPSNFGYISFISAYFAYFLKLVDYSFNIYSVRDVSISGETNSSEIFTRVFLLKLVLFIFAVIISFVIYSIFFKDKIDLVAFWFSAGSLFALCFTPYWFFKGKQEMKYISLFNIINKSSTLILILLFVVKKEDFINYFIVDFSTNIVIAVIVTYYVFRKYKIKFVFESYKNLYDYFKKGLMIFLSEIYAFVYSSSNVLILGFLVDNSIVGFYALSEKILNLLKGLFSPFVQAAYPALSIIVKESPKRARRFLVNASIIMGSIGFIVFLLVFNFSDEILSILIGKNNLVAVNILRMLSPIIFSYSVAVIFSNLYLHSFGYFTLWNKLVIITFLLTVLFIVSLMFCFNNYLKIVIYTSLFSEIFIAISSILIFLKYKSDLELNGKI